MRLRLATLLMMSAAAGLYAGVGTGCDPYAPELPDQPFFCASGTPRCPSGYVCDDSPTLIKPTCKRASGGGSDGGPSTDGMVATSCDGPPDRDFEPNDSTAAAIQLPAQHYVVDSVGICSQDDADMYWAMLTGGQHLTLRLDFTHTAGDLTLAVLDNAASQLRFSDGSSMSNNFESIDITNIPGGKYYFKIKGKDPGVRNTYTLTLDVQ
ncbi:MAG: PPC domain-containing protein [Deltaproteobacteria bacterium]|nr:PPC domain-containing protein [Deltaproteobacteria bacterium]